MRRRIAAAAASLIGVRWAERGRAVTPVTACDVTGVTRDTAGGLDCLGHVLEAVRRATGVELPDPLIEGWACWRLFVRPLRAGEPVEGGDLAMARSLPPFDKIDHVGIVAADQRTIWHAARGTGVLRSSFRVAQVCGYRRFRPEAFGAAA